MSLQIVSKVLFRCFNAAAALMILLLAGQGRPAMAGPTEKAGPAGGTIIAGALPPGTSGLAAIRAGMHWLHGQFDTAPKMLQAVRSRDGHITLVVFRAVRHGALVGGLAVATGDSTGHVRFAALFDAPAHLHQSLLPMLRPLNAETRAALEKERPAGGRSGPDFARFEAAASSVRLTRTAFPDGTATIGVAPGFTPTMMRSGQFSVASADGAYANLYLPVGMLDPNGANYRMESQISGGHPPQIPGQTVIAYDRDPVAVWKTLLRLRADERGDADPSPSILRNAPLPMNWAGATMRMVAGTMTLHGEPYVFSGRLLVGPPPSAEGAWLFQITMRAAPAAHAARDMPALIAMQNSEHVDMNAVRAQTMRNIAAINAACSHWLAANQIAGDDARNRRFQSAMQEAAASQDSIDRSSAGFIHYLNDEAVVAHDPTGAHGTLDAGLADALVKSDPEHFHVVPVSQYTPGTDY